MQTLFYPQHVARVGALHPAPAARARKLAPATSRRGDWHYLGLPKTARIPWIAALISAGLHAGLLWGGGARPAYRPVAVVRDEAVIQLVMPPLDEDEEKPVEELDQADPDPGVQVPQLADLPTKVDLTNAFVQPLDMRTTLQNSLDTSKLTSIPLKIAPAGPRPGALKDIFNLSQLDRVPQALVQPAPEFPYNLKKQVDRAEVVLEFIVDTHGETREIRVMSSTHPGFERASIDGVAKWHFRPGMKGGRKVNTRMLVPIRFFVTPGD